MRAWYACMRSSLQVWKVVEHDIPWGVRLRIKSPHGGWQPQCRNTRAEKKPAEERSWQKQERQRQGLPLEETEEVQKARRCAVPEGQKGARGH